MAIAFLMMVASTKLFAQVSIGVGISVHLAPPALPVYTQPVCPGDGYIWTPGYWAYGDDGYYWVPGVWVRPPHYGLLWTPGYWGFTDGVYVYHAGYWGPHVGFYGGINYGFGYGGVGFGGGVWAGNVFRYNTAVTNVNTTVVHNTYVNNTVINNTVVNNNRVSFNGQGGVNARPTPQEQTAMSERHIDATPQQQSHMMAARQDRSQLASQNGGHPAVAAMNRINGRKFDQQGRIANGIHSGQLTAGETKNLENGQKNINQQERADRAADNGHLTQQDRQQLKQDQNQESKDIYNDKHNASRANYANNEVGQRRFNQQQRIANGIAAGQLHAGQAARLEGREQNINRQIAADRQANRGRLMAQQYRQVNHQQNHLSRQIQHERHR